VGQASRRASGRRCGGRSLEAARIGAVVVGREREGEDRFVWEEGRSRWAVVGSIGESRLEGWRWLGEGRIVVAVARRLEEGHIAVVGLGRRLEELFFQRWSVMKRGHERLRLRSGGLEMEG